MNARCLSSVFIAVLIGAAVVSAPFAAESAAAAWYGTVETSAAVPLDGDGDIGQETEMRLILEAKPESGIGFRAEGGVLWKYGGASEQAAAFESGLAAAPSASGLPAGTDLHRTVSLDQAYAYAALGRADLSFGVVPCAWGTGYLFNPTARVAPAAFPGAGTETAPGTLGAVVRFALPAGFSAEAYAFSQPRLRSAVPSADEAAVDRFPFGAKLQVRSEPADVSVSLFRELADAGSDPAYWTGADAAGFAGPVSWYVEAALRMPEGGERWNVGAASEAVIGFSWTVPGPDAILRVEAIRLGSGADDAADYDAAGLVAGERVLLAKRYLFVMLEKEDPDAGRWKLEGGALVNADDGSTALLAEATLIPLLSFELAAFAHVFLSGEDGELGGTRALGGAEFVPYRSAAGIRAKVSF